MKDFLQSTNHKMPSKYSEINYATGRTGVYNMGRNMSIEKNIEKVVDQNVEQITRDFKSFIPDNIVEIAIGYSISFVFALLIFFIGKWISKSVVKILGKALRKVGGVVFSSTSIPGKDATILFLSLLFCGSWI